MTSIFVAKLDFGVTDTQLRELFERHGSVVKSQIAKDRETGKPRGFAFVEMSDPEEAKAAISALDGSTINGRAIVVKLAEDRGGSGGASRPASRPPQDRPFNSRPPQSPRDSSAPSDRKPGNDFDAPYIKPKSDDDDDLPLDSIVEKTPKRGPKAKKKPLDDRPDTRETKMSAYKKSGKKSRIEFDDDDDWELEFRLSLKRDDDDDE